MEVKQSIVAQIRKYLIFGLIFIITLMAITLYAVLKYTSQKEINSILVTALKDIEENLELRGRSAVLEANMIAENSRVKETYVALKREVGDLSKVTEQNKAIFEKYGRLLRQEVDPILKAIKRDFGITLRIHFHLPGPRSFIRTWRNPGEDIRLDDLSGFRFAVATAQKEKRSVTGLEPGREGLVYRGIVPIIVNGEVLGSVESGEHLSTHLKEYMKGKEDTLKHYVIILKKDLEKIMEFYIKEGKAKLLDQAILYDQSQNVTPELLNKIINKAEKSKQFFQIGNYYFIKIPLKSYVGEEIGYIAVSYDATSTVRLFHFVTLALVAIFILISVFFVMSINKVLHRNASTIITTAKAMEELAQGRGDLTFRLKVEKEDEMGLLSRYLNQFIESLATMIRQFLEKVKELFSSSEDLNKEAQILKDISKDLSERADAINISSAEILSAVEEISRSLQELSKAISEISDSAQGSSKVVRETVNTVEETKNRVELLNKASSEIDEVINLINDIAKQTNLLALNASIEAARAGESGRGFAVVANEVKELAIQTQEATKVIAEKIYLLKQSSEEVSNGVEEVVALIRKVEDAATAIAGAVEEQSIVINNISQHILNVKEKVMVNEDQTSQIKKTVEELLIITEQINKISQNLHMIAQEIHDLASQFKT